MKSHIVTISTIEFVFLNLRRVDVKKISLLEIQFMDLAMQVDISNALKLFYRSAGKRSVSE